MPKGTHGTPIWVRTLTGKAKLSSAKSNRLLLYLGTTTDGPRHGHLRHGPRPEGQGAQGRLADRHLGPRHDRHRARLRALDRVACPRSTTRPLLNRWLKAGYAVVRTDYEGLGTPTRTRT